MRSSTTTLESLPTLRAARFNDAGWLESGARNDYVSDGLVAAIVAAPDGLLITALTMTGALTSVRIATGWRAGGREQQDIERRDGGPALREGVAKDRMPSLHDPQMRHGRKSKAKQFYINTAHDFAVPFWLLSALLYVAEGLRSGLPAKPARQS